MVVQDNADNHTHHVNVENGVPVPCECPADAYHDGTCKYRVTVAIHEPVLAAATTDDSRDRISTDGGDLIVAGELGIIYKVITDAVVAGMVGFECRESTRRSRVESSGTPLDSSTEP